MRPTPSSLVSRDSGPKELFLGDQIAVGSKAITLLEFRDKWSVASASELAAIDVTLVAEGALMHVEQENVAYVLNRGFWTPATALARDLRPRPLSESRETEPILRLGKAVAAADSSQELTAKDLIDAYQNQLVTVMLSGGSPLPPLDFMQTIGPRMHLLAPQELAQHPPLALYASQNVVLNCTLRASKLPGFVRLVYQPWIFYRMQQAASGKPEGPGDVGSEIAIDVRVDDIRSVMHVERPASEEDLEVWAQYYQQKLRESERERLAGGGGNLVTPIR